MRRHETRLPAYPRVEIVLNAIADWIRRYGSAVGVRDEFAQCSPEDVAATAKELGLNANELRTLASKGPHAADLLKRLLVALHVDPNAPFDLDLRIANDLHRMCITCSNKVRCVRELGGGTAADNYYEYCPNAVTLDALFRPARPTGGESACPACKRSGAAEQRRNASDDPPPSFPPSFRRLATRAKNDNYR